MRRALLALLFLIGAGCADDALVDDPGEMVPPRVEVVAPVTALVQGETTQLSATYFDETGEAEPQTTFAWTTSNPSVATVADDATVTGIAPGQTMIQAAAHGVDSDPLTLTVVGNADEVADVVITPASATLQPGETQQFEAAVRNVNGDPLPDVAVTWASDAPSIATVDAEGLVTAVATGTAAITATAEGVGSAPATVEVPSPSRSGLFAATAGHEAGGIATLERQANGSLRLTFGDNFFVTDGPNLFVFLSGLRGVDDTSFQVAELTSTSGGQAYVVQGVDLDAYEYVVIYCIPFNATFASAQLN